MRKKKKKKIQANHQIHLISALQQTER